MGGSGAMKRRPILVTVGFLLVAFGLGLGVGSRFGQRPVVYREVPIPSQSTSASSESAPAAETSAVVGAAACVDVRDAASLEGKSGCVSGRILRVYSSRAENTFLDFCEDFRTCPFTSVIFAKDKNKFGDLATLQGRRVEIRGEVVNYQGRAEIVIHDPQQVRSAP